MSNSFRNLIEPLISTSLERMSLPECSAIYFLGSIVDGVGLGSSRWVRRFSSVPALNDPSPIDDMGFCGMNFFSTPHYGNIGSLCQWITEGNHLFRRKFEPERLFRLRFDADALEIDRLDWSAGMVMSS